MKHLENEYGFEEAKINDNTGQMVKFFNQGPENDWKNILNDEIKKKIELKFHQEMKELGYL